MIICEFMHQCASYPWRCEGCENNKGKQDHFQPKQYRPLCSTHTHAL